MNEINYLETVEDDSKLKRLLRHCFVCFKKKNLIFHHTSNFYVFQICNKCLDKEGSIPSGVLK